MLKRLERMNLLYLARNLTDLYYTLKKLLLFDLIYNNTNLRKKFLTIFESKKGNLKSKALLCCSLNHPVYGREKISLKQGEGGENKDMPGMLFFLVLLLEVL